jgi:hypothetical protein
MLFTEAVIRLLGRDPHRRSSSRRMVKGWLMWGAERQRFMALAAQWIEQRFPKPCVAGSIPAEGVPTSVEADLAVRRAQLCPSDRDVRLLAYVELWQALKGCASPVRGRPIGGS